MTRMHFTAIARVIASLPVSEDQRRVLAEAFAGILGDFNSRFDRAKFLAAACGEEA